MVWPDSSWALSKIFGDNAVRTIAGITLIMAAISFILGGIGVFVKQAWWNSLVIYTAFYASFLFILLWNGGLQSFGDKGGIGILINLVILVLLLLFKWPAFE